MTKNREFEDLFSIVLNVILVVTILFVSFNSLKSEKMKYILEIPENKTAYAEEFFKSISFIKNVKMLLPNEITNAAILKSIEDYESKNVKPIPFNLAELKAMIDA